MNIPIVQPVSTKAVFTSQDVTNTFEEQIKQQHAKRLDEYKRKQLTKRLTKGARS